MQQTPSPITIDDLTRIFVGHSRQIPVAVIDSSKLIADIRYQAKKPDRRTLLQRALEAGVLRCFVPELAVAEVTKRLPEIAQELQISNDHILQIWAQQFRAHLNVVSLDPRWNPRSHLLRDLRDPNDRDFILLAHLTSATWVVAQDDDLRSLGIAEQDPSNSLRLIRIHNEMYDSAHLSTLMTVAGTRAASEAAAAAANLASSAWKKFRELHPLVQIVIAGGVAYLAYTNYSQQQLPDHTAPAKPAEPTTWQVIRSGVAEGAKKIATAAVEHQLEMRRLHQQLCAIPGPDLQPRTVREYIGYVLSRTYRPLPALEILSTIQGLGYTSSRSGAERYFLDQLWNGPEFNLSENGTWFLGLPGSAHSSPSQML